MKAPMALAAVTLLAVPALNLPAATGATEAPRIAAPVGTVQPRDAQRIGRPAVTDQVRADAVAVKAQEAAAAQEVKVTDTKPTGDETKPNDASTGTGSGSGNTNVTTDTAATSGTAIDAAATDQQEAAEVSESAGVSENNVATEAPEKEPEPRPLIMRDPTGPDIVAQEIVFLSWASDADVAALVDENRFSLNGYDRLASLGLVMVTARLAPGDDLATAIDALSNDSRVAWAQPNHIYWLLSGEGSGGSGVTSSRERGLAMHGLAARRSSVSGTIAVIDGPVDRGNPALAGARIEEEQFGIDGLPSPHGTAIAEILVGTGNFKGVAQGARLLSLPAFHPVGTEGWQSTTRHVARALERAVTARPQVLNLSFGTKKIDRTAHALLDLLEANGTCVAAAAGNGGGKVLFPGLLDQTVAVTAVDGSRTLYPYASRGPEVNVAAWGVNMSAAVPGGRRPVSGTSFATAVVAGSMMHMPACNGGRAPAVMRLATVGDALDLGDDALFGAGLFQLGAASLAAVPEGVERTGAVNPPVPASNTSSSILIWALPFGLLGLFLLIFLLRRRKSDESNKGT